MCTRHENVHSCSPYIEFVRCKLIYHSLKNCTKNALTSVSVFVMTLYGLNLDSAVRTRSSAISIWRNARGQKNGMHQPE